MHKKKKVLVLSGGGLTGMAVHSGVLSAFYRHHMTFDMVIGTSAGAFIGYLYALGYSSNEIFQILYEDMHLKRKLLLSFNFRFWEGLLTGKHIIQYLNTISKYRTLQKQFIAIACNLETGFYKLWHKDITPEKIFSSMAFPIVFKPIIIANRQYADGGITKNLGINVLKRISTDRYVTYAIDVISNNINGRVHNPISYLLRIINIVRTQLKKEDLEDVKGTIHYIPIKVKGSLLPGYDEMLTNSMKAYNIVNERLSKETIGD